ncbi:MAG: thioredoxin family protein [Planctomyces sp.]
MASEFNVQSIPTLAFVVQGKVVGQAAGAPPEATLRRVLNQLTSAA